MNKLKITLLTLLVVIISALFAFIYYLKNSEEFLTKFVFEDGKASFESDEVQFSFYDFSPSESNSIELKKIASIDFDDDNLSFRSSKSFIFNGKLNDFSGKLKVKFKVPEDLIQEYGESLEFHLFIIAFEESYRIPLKDTVLMPNYMRIKIDTEKKEAYGIYDFSNHSSKDENVDFQIGFELICYEDPLLTKESDSHNFLALDTKNLSETSLNYTLSELDSQFSKISNLNFAPRQSSKPIQVRFTDLTDNESVYFIQNLYVPEKKWIEINKKPYINVEPDNLSNSEISNLKMLSGKSLMSYCLNNYSLNNEFNWAVANWYESIALSDSLHVQEFEPQDFKALNSPFFFTQNAEKFNSLFFSFLMRKGGLFFGSDLYKTLKDNNLSLQKNMQKVLNQKQFSNIYVEFFDVLLRNPQKLYPAFTSNSFFDYLPFDRARMQVKLVGKKIEVTHNEEFSLAKKLNNSSKNTYLVNFELENYSAAFLKFDLKALNSEAKKKFLDGEYKLRISVSGDDAIGALIYQNLGGNLVSSAKNTVFYTSNGISTADFEFTGEYFLAIVNFDSAEVEEPIKKSITIKFEIIE